MKSSFQIIVIGALVATLTTLASAQVPQMINYQGKLTSATGGLIDTTMAMEFKIYDDSTGGTILWQETQNSVKVEKGIFNVLLGSVSPLIPSVFDGNIRYLGVNVGDDPEITPRKPMVSVAYAYRAASADACGAIKGTYDSGWFNIAPTTSYDLTHNLGTDKLMVTIWVKNNATGYVSIVRGAGAIEMDPWDNLFAVAVCNPTSNTIRIRTANTLQNTVIDPNNAHTSHSADQARIILLGMK